MQHDKRKTSLALGRAYPSARLNTLFYIPLIGRICIRTIRPFHLPKSNQLVIITYRIHPPSLVIIRPQLFEISCYISFWPHLSLVKNRFKIKNKFLDPDLELDLHQNGSISSVSRLQSVCKVSSKSVHNFLRYPTIYSFWLCLSIVKTNFTNIQIQIRIDTKIE